MYIFCISLLTFFITADAIFALADQDFNLFGINNDNENLFLDTIPTDRYVTTDASPATLNLDNHVDHDLSPETQNDFLTASNDECLFS